MDFAQCPVHPDFKSGLRTALSDPVGMVDQHPGRPGSCRRREFCLAVIDGIEGQSAGERGSGAAQQSQGTGPYATIMQIMHANLPRC